MVDANVTISYGLKVLPDQGWRPSTLHVQKLHFAHEAGISLPSFGRTTITAYTSKGLKPLYEVKPYGLFS